MGKVVDLSRQRNTAENSRKEQRADALKSRFEKALPSPGNSPKEKLLGIFKRKNRTDTPGKPSRPKGEGW